MLFYLGKNFLCFDFLGGVEFIFVLCINDVDSDFLLYLKEYIIKFRFIFFFKVEMFLWLFYF